MNAAGCDEYGHNHNWVDELDDTEYRSRTGGIWRKAAGSSCSSRAGSVKSDMSVEDSTVDECYGGVSDSESGAPSMVLHFGGGGHDGGFYSGPRGMRLDHQESSSGRGAAEWEFGSRGPASSVGSNSSAGGGGRTSTSKKLKKQSTIEMWRRTSVTKSPTKQPGGNPSQAQGRWKRGVNKVSTVRAFAGGFKVGPAVMDPDHSASFQQDHVDPLAVSFNPSSVSSVSNSINIEDEVDGTRTMALAGGTATSSPSPTEVNAVMAAKKKDIQDARKRTIGPSRVSENPPGAFSVVEDDVVEC